MAQLPPGIRRLPSGSFQWRVKVDGVQHRGTEHSVAAARKARAEAQLIAGHSAALKKATVREAIELWKQQAHHEVATAKTRDYILAYLPAQFLDRSIRTVDAPDIAALWFQLSAAGVSHSQLVKLRGYLSKSWRLAAAFGMVTRNPVAAVDLPTARRRATSAGPDIPDHQMVSRLVDEFAAVGDPLAAWIRLASVTGARPGELCGLEWDRLDLTNHTVTFSAGVGEDGQITSGKLGPRGHRVVELDPTDRGTIELLRAVPRIVGRPWVFTIDRFGTPYRPAYVRRAINRAADELDLEPFTPYALRHLAASTALAGGVPLTEVAHMLGDNPATVARTYSHFIPRNRNRSAGAVAAALDSL